MIKKKFYLYGGILIGSLTAVTPAKQFTDNFFDSVDNPNDGAVNALINGTAPVNADGIIDNAGKINASTAVNINSGYFD